MENRPRRRPRRRLCRCLRRRLRRRRRCIYTGPIERSTLDFSAREILNSHQPVPIYFAVGICNCIGHASESLMRPAVKHHHRSSRALTQDAPTLRDLLIFEIARPGMFIWRRGCRTRPVLPIYRLTFFNFLRHAATFLLLFFPSPSLSLYLLSPLLSHSFLSRGCVFLSPSPSLLSRVPFFLFPRWLLRHDFSSVKATSRKITVTASPTEAKRLSTGAEWLDKSAVVRRRTRPTTRAQVCVKLETFNSLICNGSARWCF